jgi:hypothetical protein
MSRLPLGEFSCYRRGEETSTPHFLFRWRGERGRKRRGGLLIPWPSSTGLHLGSVKYRTVLDDILSLSASRAEAVGFCPPVLHLTAYCCSALSVPISLLITRPGASVRLLSNGRWKSKQPTRSCPLPPALLVAWIQIVPNASRFMSR